MTRFNGDCSWQKPLTTKLYLHPPLAERIITLWPEFKIINGSITEGTPLNAERGFGLQMLYGDAFCLVPWKESVFKMRDDGIPVHQLSWQGSLFDLSMTCFCTMDRNPATFCRLKITNKHPWPVRSSLSLMPRDGQETYMMGTGVDAYQSYEPCAESWGMLPSDWVFDKRTLRGRGHEIWLKVPDDFSCEWIDKAFYKPFLYEKLLKVNFSLAAGEERIVDIALFNGAGRDFIFEAENEKTIRTWEAELAGIKLFPATSSPYWRSMFNHLVAQCLQMFAFFKGADDVIPRQGAAVHWIWPWEAAEMLTALDRIGLYGYTEKVYEMYRNRLQVKEGPDKGMIKTIGIDWACQTGSVLWSLSVHLAVMKDRERFEYYRTMMIDAFEWIESKRDETGLFPPMRASDWPDESRSWCWTDLNTLIGMEEAARLFTMFDDDEARRIRIRAADYRSTLEKIMAGFAAEQKDLEEILIPNKLGKPLTDPPMYPYHADLGNLVKMKIVKPGSQVFRQIEAYYRNRCLMQNGLVGLMQDTYPGDLWCGHTWYLGISEMGWFYAWLETGEFEKAEASFFALVKYGMTKEFYMQERYADNDPTFVPWSPNASNNGRTIKMMLDYFNYKTGTGQKNQEGI